MLLLKLAHSQLSETLFGDPEGVIKWIQGEIEAFDEVLTDRGDFCACVGA
jgi:hypothetical protein